MGLTWQLVQPCSCVDPFWIPEWIQAMNFSANRIKLAIWGWFLESHAHALKSLVAMSGHYNLPKYRWKGWTWSMDGLPRFKHVFEEYLCRFGGFLKWGYPETMENPSNFLWKMLMLREDSPGGRHGPRWPRTSHCRWHPSRRRRGSPCCTRRNPPWRGRISWKLKKGETHGAKRRRRIEIWRF